MFIESDTVELKREYITDIKRTLIAFANTHGGTIFIGIDDSGEVIGIDNPDETIQQIVNSARDSIKPDILMFTKCEIMNIKNKYIIAVKVQSGISKPYYLAEKGLKPSGVFIRVGTTTNHATDSAIRQMIKESDGENFEDMRSLNQELTFNAASKVFEMRNLEFGNNQMKTLGLINDNNVYTNLALLLSDQCPHIIKVAVFRGTDMFNFQDRQEFSGSLFTQLDDAYKYLNMVNRTRATFNGLYRQDYRDYPEAALREALINSIVHKEYSRSVDTKISFFADRVEFISYGGIYGDESMESVLNGLSICRNPKLANIFYRLKMIEAYGTGLRKIIQCYDNAQINPEFFSTSGMFKVTLPSIIYHEECEECLSNNTVHEEPVPYIISENKQHEQILALTARKGHITRPEVQQILGVSLSTANRMLKSLQKDGKLSCIGNGKNTHYALPKQV